MGGNYEVNLRMTFAMTWGLVSLSGGRIRDTESLTMKGDDAEDEHNRECHDNDGVDLETGGFIGVEP